LKEGTQEPHTDNCKKITNHWNYEATVHDLENLKCLVFVVLNEENFGGVRKLDKRRIMVLNYCLPLRINLSPRMEIPEGGYNPLEVYVDPLLHSTQRITT
jgi:hypothetical protein